MGQRLVGDVEAALFWGLFVGVFVSIEDSGGAKMLFVGTGGGW